MKTVWRKVLKYLIKMPLSGHYINSIYKRLGVNMSGRQRISPHATIIGTYSNLTLKDNVEIANGAFILLKDKVSIGMNTAIAYNVTIITSSNPVGPCNSLYKLYPAKTEPVTIGDNVWIGANALILPGVVIHSYSVVAAGAVVNKDVPSGVVVAGVPARIVKYLPKDEC